MYEEKVVFDLENQYLLCEPLDADGEYLLNEIM